MRHKAQGVLENVETVEEEKRWKMCLSGGVGGGWVMLGRACRRRWALKMADAGGLYRQ